MYRKTFMAPNSTNTTAYIYSSLTIKKPVLDTEINILMQSVCPDPTPSSAVLSLHGLPGSAF